MALDIETKNKINNCRDILVGKIPDPKAQIEQITVALIYKFMDDIDKLYPKPIYFVDELEKYAWGHLMDQALDIKDVFDLYVEAIDTFQKSDKLPEIFKKTFLEFYLPYNDPKTLHLFLKQISWFNYSHSEKLGDAFEYLLSIMSSQGDAGQFRTPRHIIKFIVDVIKPQKNENVLDPACGTCGFLIESYKYLNQNNNNLDNKFLRKNYIGYDISSDMVRLGLVNMYFHQFTNPKIEEYDTLSNKEKWDDKFDIILTNPPFMTPKGGIRPHDKFSIQANRSEILFLEYIIEHLKRGGRCGVIVPEGIIFQTNKAYKTIRKTLIQQGLFCVVSLPSGVFNPYSGVKTSILFIDKTLKENDEILFVKVENDGHHLGAQRRAIENNDLPQAQDIIEHYIKHFNVEKANANLSHSVKKKDIINNDFNLSGEQYKAFEEYKGSYPLVELEEVAEVSSGNSAPQEQKYFEKGNKNFFRTSDVGLIHIGNLEESRDKINDLAIKNFNLKEFEKGTILFPKSGASTFLNHRVMMKFKGFVSSHLATIKANPYKILDEFLFYLLLKIDAKNLCPNQTYPSLKTSVIKKIKIPLPPLDIQKQIVEKIEVKEKAIESAKSLIQNLERERENFGDRVKEVGNFEMVELGELGTFRGGNANIKKEDYGYGTPFITYKNVFNNKSIKKEDLVLMNIKEKDLSRFDAIYGDIFFTGSSETIKDSAMASVLLFDMKDLTFNGFCKRFRLNSFDNLLPEFAKHILHASFVRKQLEESVRGAGIRYNTNQENLKKIKILLPPIDIQQKLVEEQEEQEKTIKECEKTITIMKSRIEKEMGKVWGSE